MKKKPVAKAQPLWPADQVQRRKVAELIPYANNARTHSDEQVEQIAASIREFGFTNPVLLAEDGTIIAGHGRVLAAKLLGLPEVSTMVAVGWTEQQRRAYVLADNQLALLAGWDEGLLRLELGALQTDGYDLSLIGFPTSDLARLLAPEASGDPDEEAPEPPANPVSVPGDVWVLGNHRLMCGDSTDADAVATLLDGAAPHLMATDPPYGVEYDPSWRAGAKAKGKVLNDDRADWREAWALFPGDVAYVWHGGLHGRTVQDSLAAEGFDVRAQIIWAKSQPAMGRGNYHWQHEPCFYAVRRGGKAHWSGDRKQATLWPIDKPRANETGHGTQKPVECMARPLRNNSVAGDAVYEPFSGSGTTIIAAEMLARRCYAMELSPAYVDVAVMRWEQFTGRKAATTTGKTLAALAVAAE